MEESVDESVGHGSSAEQPVGTPGNTVRAIIASSLKNLKGFGENGFTSKCEIEPPTCVGIDGPENELDASSTRSGDANPTLVESARKRSRDDSESSSEIAEGCESIRSLKRRLIEAEDQASGEDHTEAEGGHGLSSSELGSGATDHINANNEEPSSVEVQAVATFQGGTEATPTAQRLQSDTDAKSVESGDPETGEASSTESTDPDVTDPFSIDRLRKRQCRWLSTKLENTIKVLEGKAVLPSEVQLILRLSQVIRERYQQSQTRKKPPPPVNRNFPQSEKALSAIFKGPAEDNRSWMSSSCSEQISWRICNHSSKGQVRDAKFGIFAGKSIHAGGFGTDRERRIEIELHSNFGNRKLTCFISFTISFSGMTKMIAHFLKREKKQSPARTIMIHLMNNSARNRAGRPILRMRTEIISHKCITTRGPDFYKDEVLVPFQAWPEDLVWSWRLHDIITWMTENKASYDDWRLKVAVPCFEEHERLSLAGAGAAKLRNAVADLLRISMPYALEYLHI